MKLIVVVAFVCFIAVQAQPADMLATSQNAQDDVSADSRSAVAKLMNDMARMPTSYEEALTPEEAAATKEVCKRACRKNKKGSFKVRNCSRLRRYALLCGHCRIVYKCGKNIKIIEDIH